LVIIAANVALWLFQPSVTAKETNEHKSKDGYSVITILIMSVLSTITPIIDWAYLPHQSEPLTAVTIAGFIMLWTGVLLRNYSIKILGKHFTATTSGPYGIIRHPSYLGALLAMMGSAIFLNSLIGVTVSFIAMMIAYTIRIQAEEKVLKSLFGNVYTEYQQKTKKIIPFLW
jgi:protein-S-isoprenylcysteine O-methyltransferase Ste14